MSLSFSSHLEPYVALQLHFQGCISSYLDGLRQLDAARAKDQTHGSTGGEPSVHNSSYWVQWNGASFIQEATQAAESSRMLAYMDRHETQEKWVASVVAHALDKALRRPSNVSSRSTSVASNLTEDAEGVFYAEIAKWARDHKLPLG